MNPLCTRQKPQHNSKKLIPSNHPWYIYATYMLLLKNLVDSWQRETKDLLGRTRNCRKKGATNYC